MTQRRRGFGRVRQERSGRYSAAYIGPDLVLHRAPDTFPARIDAEGWLSVERRSIDLDQWLPPEQRQQVRVRPEPEARRESAGPTVGEYATAWLDDRCERTR